MTESSLFARDLLIEMCVDALSPLPFDLSPRCLAQLEEGMAACRSEVSELNSVLGTPSVPTTPSECNLTSSSGCPLATI